MKSARCFTALYQDKPVAFIALIINPYGGKYYRVSRLVVLPDYQGIGIGTKLLTAIAKYWTTKTQMPLFLITSNPQLKQLHKRSKWVLTRYGHVGKGGLELRLKLKTHQSTSINRQTFSFRYNPDLIHRNISVS